VGNPIIRWNAAVWRNDVNLLQIRNTESAARERGRWRKKIGEVKAPPNGIDHHRNKRSSVPTLTMNANPVLKYSTVERCCNRFSPPKSPQNIIIFLFDFIDRTCLK
jgi:hypothetical protein